MGDSNKVLSVSYGTFSCRLEGFDDSVETMKAVVSYFHELAGHDRFMDMDPQAPDVDALAELAQEEDGAPVEVTTVAGAVSLRVAQPEVEEDDDSGIANLRDALATPAPEDFEEVAEETDDVLAEDEAEPVADTADEEDDEQPLDAEEAAEDDAAPFELIAEDESDNDDTFAGMDAEEEDAEAAEADVVSDDTDDLVEEEVAENTDAVVEDAAEDDSAVEADEAPETAGDAPAEDETPFYDPAAARDASEDSDSVAAKLERIRALVGRVPPANRGAPPAQPETTDSEESVVARLSALTGKSEAEAPRSEDIVDGFEFKNDDGAPLVLSDDDATDDDDVVAEADADEEDELAMRRQNQSKRANLPENDDDAMSRMMSQADQRLNEPEGRRHRDAFAQLKAAVAATEAARQLGDAEEESDPEDAFREDLDEAVREDDDTAEQPAAVPLKLVAEQRIEETPSNPADRLRQIASVKEGQQAPSAGFAEFAEMQGATELGDLLEAAAAYIAFVEGDDDFSRPQVMKKVQLAAADTFTREDGLRSFGRLLRQSRIIKLNNGRFQVSEDTRFRPADKAAQG